MLLYIIRHGDPIYETDTLTERGWLQAEAVGKRMVNAKIDRIFTSPMGRAKDTAAPACRMLGLEYTVEEWAQEIEDDRLTPYPDGVMKSVSFIPESTFRANGNISLSYDDAFACAAISESNMRRARDVIEEGGRDFLERLGYREENGVYRILRPSDERIALFCHSNMERAWLSSLLHIPLHLMWAGFEVTHTGVTVIEFRNRESGFTVPKCHCFSDMSHLYAEGLDMKHGNRLEL